MEEGRVSGKLRKGSYFLWVMSPLAVARSQRKCWNIVVRKCHDGSKWRHGFLTAWGWSDTSRVSILHMKLIWSLFWSLNNTYISKFYCSAWHLICFPVFLYFLDTISINPKDTRWVGAWWLGLLICGAVNFTASLPFWVLPYSLPKEGENENVKISHLPSQGDHCKIESPAQPQLKFSEAVKGEWLLPKCLHVNSLSLVHSELSMDLHNPQQNARFCSANEGQKWSLSFVVL